MKKDQKRHVWISAGHTNIVGDDRGANGNGYHEGELTVEFRDLVCGYLDEMGIAFTKDNNAHALSKTLNAFKNSTKSSDLVIDIHFNAATPRATGCEVFVPSTPTKLELELAENGVRTISEILDIPMRGNFQGFKGVKSERESRHQRLGWMGLRGNNVLFEICFISNSEDMSKYQKHKGELARRIARDIAKHVYTVDSDNGTANRSHKIVAGDTLSKIAEKYNLSTTYLMALNNLSGHTIYAGHTLKL